MTPVIYIPDDSGALALGAEKVAKAIAAKAKSAFILPNIASHLNYMEA